MDTFSAETKVELTAEGWLYVAGRNARAAARVDDPAAALTLSRMAKDQANRAAMALGIECGALIPESAGCR
jgi:hypothetical protein